MARKNRYIQSSLNSRLAHHEGNLIRPTLLRALPPIGGASPFSMQMAMMRYWMAHGKPARLQIVGGDRLLIEAAGKDSILIAGKPVVLHQVGERWQRPAAW